MQLKEITGAPAKVTATPPAVGTAAIVQGLVRIGRMLGSRDTWTQLENPSLAAVLATIPAGQDPAELAIEIDGAGVFVDVDTHHWNTKPSPAALDTWLADVTPCPDAAWRTHGHGLRLLYVGPFARPRAVAAAVGLPVAFKIEIKRESRHPLSTRADKPGASCGPVSYGVADPAAEYIFRVGGNFTPELRAQALEQLHMEDGGRYDHELCPIDPGAHTNATACVSVYRNVVKCFRCEGAGTRYRPHLKPGIFPLAALVGAEATDLDRLATNYVHWTQAQTELQAVYPHLGTDLLKEAYRLSLEAWHGKDDLRLGYTFQPALDFVWGSNVWLGYGTFEPRKVDRDAADAAPYCLSVVDKEVKEGAEPEKTIAVNKGRRSQFINSTPQGYKPVRPYRGLDFRPPDGSAIPVQVAYLGRHPIRLLSKPEGDTQAFERVSEAFPRIDRTYLYSCIAAGICASHGGGRRPQICADGPSGSGKGETPRLAASFLGDDVIKVRLNVGDEEFNRYIGSALVSGRRFLAIDELGKTPGLQKRFATLLQLSSTITWRPLYRPPVTTDFTAALFYPSVNFPEWLKNSTEFARRVRRVRLVLRVPEWSETCGGDTVKWRDRSQENAHAANALLTHVHAICAAHNYEWEKIADALGLGRLDDDIDVPDPEQYRDLYRYCRGDLATKPEYVTDNGFVKGWVNLESGKAKEVVSRLIDFDQRDHKTAQRMVKHNLEALPWNNILGFETPAVRIRVRIHGGKWACRFEHPRGSRGNELINADLPPIPGPAITPVPVQSLDDKGRANLKLAGVNV